MKTLSEDEILEIENKEQYIIDKANLLKEYKSYEENLEFSDDEFEESLILDKRNKLAIQIKALGDKIRNIALIEEKA